MNPKKHVQDCLGFLFLCTFIIVCCVLHDTNVRLNALVESQTTCAAHLSESIEQLDTMIVAQGERIENLTNQLELLRKQVQALQEFENSPASGFSEMNAIRRTVFKVCAEYGNIVVDSYLVLALIQQESGFDPYAKNGPNIGLVQISTRWHQDRANRLGVSDWYDAESNIRMGVDYLCEIQGEVQKVRHTCDARLILMIYRLGYSEANRLYDSGQIHSYATSVLNTRDRFMEGV